MYVLKHIQVFLPGSRHFFLMSAKVFLDRKTFSLLPYTFPFPIHVLALISLLHQKAQKDFVKCFRVLYNSDHFCSFLNDHF